MRLCKISGYLKYRSFILLLLLVTASPLTTASDYYVTGRITDLSGSSVPNATVVMSSGSVVYSAQSASDGTYSLRISGVYSEFTGSLETGIPFPVPFTYSVNIPFMVNKSGDVHISIYNLLGQKIKDNLYPGIQAGSYRFIWDGCNQSGSPERTGFYIYVITFDGVSKSGRLVKAVGASAFASATSLEPVILPPVSPPSGTNRRIQVITGVTCQDYYPVRLTDITIGKDTIIDFVIELRRVIAYKASDKYIYRYTGSDFKPLNLKGINLGTSPPGTFPGEIAYAISPETYERWIAGIAAAGFNSLRVYTLHPPVFYEKLANYNYRHPDKPLLLFQGIWLEEVEPELKPASLDLFTRLPSFTTEIHEVINCINGNDDIAFRPGKSYGRYLTDVSQWTAGYILGREISPDEIIYTDANNASATSYSGFQLALSGGTPSEVFITSSMDESIRYEYKTYKTNRPVSMTSWPTLDPLHHPTEVGGQEDVATFDMTKISRRNEGAGLFVSYHAYPYYPNFISYEPAYRTYNDIEGADSYLGYLVALKSYYLDIPVVIAEFGVPSSWGSAHQSFSQMNHGGYSEKQQGEKDSRMLKNILDAGCAGGFMFSWFDEWFKPTWIVGYLEAYGFYSGGLLIPTRQLWQNFTSPEQNFGLLGFTQKYVDPFKSMAIDNNTGPVKMIEAASDNSFLYINIGSSGSFRAGDTVMVAFDTYLKDTGESKLPNGKLLQNRSEFLLSMILGNDSALHYVTQAYDMNGLTPAFDLANHSVQMFSSTVTDGAPWELMRWINDGYYLTADTPGRLPMINSARFDLSSRSAVAWAADTIKIRIPWTMLYFYDPTRMDVIDGAISTDGGWTYNIITAQSDGIAFSVYNSSVVVSTTDRYTWPKWLIVPGNSEREKASLPIIRNALLSIPDFAW